MQKLMRKAAMCEECRIASKYILRSPAGDLDD